MKTSFSRNFKRIMDEQQRTQPELAAYLGVSQQTVSKWYNGLCEPRMGKVEQIANFLHVKKTDLILDAGTPEYDEQRNLVLILAFAQKFASLDNDKQEVIMQLIDTWSKE